MPDTNTDNQPIDADMPKKTRKRDLTRLSSEFTDGKMAEMSRLWHNLFENNLLRFTDFDSSLNPAFATDWLSKIETFEALPTNETMEDLSRSHAATVEELRKKFMLQTDALEFYVKKAFPERKRILDEFGLTRIKTPAYKRGARLLLLGFGMTQVISDYATELLAAGMPVTLPPALSDACGTLGDAMVQHEYFQLKTIRSTNERITMYNTLYKIHRQVYEAAIIIFNERPDIARQFGN